MGLCGMSLIFYYYLKTIENDRNNQRKPKILIMVQFCLKLLYCFLKV